MAHPARSTGPLRSAALLGIVGVLLLSATTLAPAHASFPAPIPAHRSSGVPGGPVADAARSAAAGQGPGLGGRGSCTFPSGSAVRCQGTSGSFRRPGIAPATGGGNTTPHWLALSRKNAPSPRWAVAMVWDASDGYVLAYSGTNGASPYNDTWKFANGNWTQLTPTGGPPASGSSGGQNMVYDPVDREVILLYAVLSASGGAGMFTWAYHANAWTNVSKTIAPPAVWRESFAWDTKDNYAVMFGGCTTNSCGTLSNLTWSYAGGTWTNRTAPVAPPPLARAGLQFDPADGYLLLVDGYLANTTANNQTWEYLSGNWTLLAPPVSPTPCDGALIGSFGSFGGVYLFGGELHNYGGVLGNATWYFLHDNWTKLSTPTAPPRSGITMMSWDAANSTLLYFGAYNGGGTNDTWELVQEFGADVSFTPDGTDVGRAMEFNATTSGASPGNVTYRWDFGDGSNSTSENTTHTYASVGVETVSLTARDSAGAVNEQNNSITVAPLPTATASASAHGADVGVPVHYRDVVHNGTAPFTYAWNFGDGTNATGPTPTHAFASNGSFNVSSAVTDASGAVAYSNLTIATNATEVTLATANRTAMDVGQSVQFNATPLHGTAPYNFSWVFGDRSRAYGRSVVHTYAAVGTYAVRVWTNDSAGATTLDNLSVVVHPRPTLTASASITTADSGQTITFHAHPGLGTLPYTVNWSFADGTSGVGLNVTHAYAGNGNYLATATLTDFAGASATAQVGVSINPAPHAGVSAVPTYGVPGAATQFTALVTGGTPPYAYAWEFGDGSNASGFTATTAHVYASPGRYNVTVNATDGVGVVAPAALQITVVVPLLAGLSESAAQITEGQSVAFTATATHGLAPYSYVWSHLPTGCLTQNLSVLPCLPTGYGTSEVTVTVRDAVGESTSASKTFGVLAPLLASAGASASVATSCKGPYTVNFTSTVGGGAGPYSYSWNFGDGTPVSTLADPAHTYAGPPGTFPVGLTIRDTDNATKFVSVNAVLTPVNCTGGLTSSLSGWAPWVIGLGIVLVVVAVAALVLVLRARRPPAAPSEEFTPVPVEPAEPGMDDSLEPPSG